MLGSLDRFDARSTRLVLWSVWLLLAVALTLYAVKPQYLKYNKGSDSIRLLERMTDNHAQVGREIERLRAHIAELQQRLQGDVEKLPVTEMESYFIGRLQGVSWGSDVELLAVRPGSANQVLGFDELAFEVEVRGQYPSLYNWLNKLTEKLGFVLVKHFEVKPLTSGSEDEQMRMALTLVFYRAA